MVGFGPSCWLCQTCVAHHRHNTLINVLCVDNFTIRSEYDFSSEFAMWVHGDLSLIPILTILVNHSR